MARSSQERGFLIRRPVRRRGLTELGELGHLVEGFEDLAKRTSPGPIDAVLDVADGAGGNPGEPREFPQREPAGLPGLGNLGCDVLAEHLWHQSMAGHARLNEFRIS